MMPKKLKSIFLGKVLLEDGELKIDITEPSGGVGSILFEYPRAFRVFSESDGYRYLDDVELSEALLEADDGTGVYNFKNSGFLMEYLRTTPKSRLDLQNYACMVITPDECVEVIV